ncbi:MAG TPA: flagellar motor protein [Syntrophales bacterium]|nr:flagellar motor protein [Syntrophales bacterium]
MDIAAFVGIILGVGSLVVGNIVEGGTTAHLFQVVAAVIVFGGTLGATLLSFSMRDIMNAVKSLRMVFARKPSPPDEIIADILSTLNKARRMGLLALEQQLNTIHNDFLRKGIGFIVDGMDPAMIRELLYQEVATYEETVKKAARVFEASGGYAPTIGILGAVLGLIQVMKNVTDPSKIGGGIATAFVATIYGVASANLILIPIGKKIMNRLREEVLIRELIIEGVLGVESGVNPYFLRVRLNSFLAEHEKS